MTSVQASKDSPQGQTRRGVIQTVLMALGVVAGYGLGLVHFFRYLVPLRHTSDRREMFVGTLDSIPFGTTVSVKDPQGREINLVRSAVGPEELAGEAAGDAAEEPSERMAETARRLEREFKALSSKCPHLGCRVHWEAANERFFCPCHDGAFDRQGVATAGPPAKEHKNLTTYEVKVDPKNGWVFVMVTQERAHGV